MWLKTVVRTAIEKLKDNLCGRGSTFRDKWMLND